LPEQAEVEPLADRPGSHPQNQSRRPLTIGGFGGMLSRSISTEVDFESPSS